MKIRVHHRAGPHQTWGPHAFDSAIGRIIPLVIGGVRIGDARLVSVSYTENYRIAILLIEVADKLT